MLRIAVILACLAVPVFAEDKGKAPPLPDGITVRTASKKASRPCVLLIRVDTSEALAALARKVGLGVVKSDNVEFREEFGIDRGTAWIVVLDGKGETLASAAAGEKPEEQIPVFLKRKESLQSLERGWTKDAKNLKTRDEYLARLEEAGVWAKAMPILDAIAADAAVPQAQREDARVRSFLVRRPSRVSAAEYRDTWAEAVKVGEAIAVELPGSPRAKEVIAKLHALICCAFDIMPKLVACNDRMAVAAKALGHNPPVLPVEFLSKQRILVKADQDGVTTQESEFDKAVTAAQLGQPDPVIAFFGQPPHDKDAQFQWWVEEAKKKAGK